MDVQDVFEKFLKKSPFAVLTQAAIRGVIAEDFDEIFEQHRSEQYERSITFSAMATAVADVVLKHVKNFHQAYKAHEQDLAVALVSFYSKINHTELTISEAIVDRSAQRASQIQDRLGYQPWQVLPGYNAYAFDGNHLQESDKRLKPLRELHDAPLAGTIVARLDLQRQLIDRAYLLEDAHAQESTTIDRFLDDLGPGDLVLADRHYCIVDFMKRADAKGVAFVLRQHGRFKGALTGKRLKVGRSETGVVYEQAIKTSHADDALVMRRITIVLDQPTRDGATEVHLLTNLPSRIEAKTIAELYRLRWEEEVVFNQLTLTFTCELKSVSHPKAALFLFCMALLAYNMRQVVFAALYAEHAQEDVEMVSHYQLSVDVERYTAGMLVVLDDEFWAEYLASTPAGIAKQLRQLSGKVDIKAYRKTVRGPKKPPKKKPKTHQKTHVSTAKVLREAAKNSP